MSKPKANDGVDLRYLDGAPPPLHNGIAFGVPWAKGEVSKSTPIALRTKEGEEIPIQSWPLAYWPDGTLKFSGHAIASSSGLSEGLHLYPSTPVEPSEPVTITTTDGSITVSTSSLSLTLPTSGSILVESLSLSSSSKAKNGRLVALYQSSLEDDSKAGPKPDVVEMTGIVEKAEVEQDGPVRGVVKVSGTYQGAGKSWLPFTVRFYVSAGGTSVRIVHNFFYDGDRNTDFIRGLGISFAVPLSQDLPHDRHVRFTSTAGGVWGEAVRVVSGLRRDAVSAVLDAQFNGQKTPDLAEWPSRVSESLDTLALWSDYALHQQSATSYTIRKRTSSSGAWLNNAGTGTRASGLVYIGGAVGGGVALGLAKFWEQWPRALEVRSAAADEAEVRAWAWDPEGGPMDLRHYDTVAHGLDLAYEDVEIDIANPHGIARSYEITLSAFTSTPSRADLAQLTDVLVTPAVLVASPEFYHSHDLFGGLWGLPDRSTQTTAEIEDRLEKILDFYFKDVEQHAVYGFLYHGNFYHTWDQTRHTWRYDVGDAWDNAELGTDIWLWTSFLRTGRADVFRHAFNMTRYLTESVTYHIGPYAGLGSRHNVIPWGDGAKEVRVSGSSLKRPAYYLTADELLGDLIRSSLQADKSLVEWEPLRKILDPPAAPTRVRIGPDWTALAGNWYTEWERTGNVYWRDKILTGLHDIASFPFGLFTGYAGAVGFDPSTAKLTIEGDGKPSNSFHLTMLFGGGELLVELVSVLDDIDDFDAVWLDFCKYYNAKDEEKIARYGEAFSSGGFEQLYAKLQAYAGTRLSEPALISNAWTNLLSSPTGVYPDPVEVGGTDVLNPILEIKDLATNDAAARGLTEIALIHIRQAPAAAVKGGEEDEGAKDEETLCDVNVGALEKSEKEAGGQSAPGGKRRMGVWAKVVEWFKRCLSPK